MSAVQRPSISQALEEVRHTSAQELLDRARALMTYAGDIDDEIWRKLQCIMNSPSEIVSCETKEDTFRTHPEYFETIFSTLASIKKILERIETNIAKIEF